MAGQEVDRRLLIALRDRPNSETDFLALRLREDVSVVEAKLQHGIGCGVVRRGSQTQLWNLTREGRMLLEVVEREHRVAVAVRRMMAGNAGLVGA